MDNEPTADGSETPTRREEQAPPRPVPVIDRYRMLQRIGEGGMGEVWLAEQTEPVRRRVAVKVIKEGMDTRRVIARFEVERQALALMDHPCVAKVFDGGATAGGRPYFAMEYIAGLPINEYCDRNKLTNRQRLELFVRVCEGVQHAHQKAILHRDLKPGNVLVTESDGRPVPKIIDFGVAKATAQRLTDQSLYTEIGIFIGTPEYMSPEQAEGAGQDIDTRTDVYSLGVILYQLLVGALPFESSELRSAGDAGMRRKIVEEEPPRPSARLSTFGGELSTETARRRSVDVPTLRHQLAGDLDWITMKALAKDRARRYGSPAELAADIGRYLGDEPVLAGPPSRSYRARKFVKRHRIGVSVGAAAVAVLIVFAATMTVQARRIAAERDRANQEAATAQRVAKFLAGLFRASDPRVARGKDPTAREILDRGVERIEKELKDSPAVRARLMTVLGTVYRGLGSYDKAQPLLEEALATFRKELGDDHLETARTKIQLAWVYRARERSAEAEALFTSAIDAFRRILGEDNVETIAAMSDLAVYYDGQHKAAEVEAIDRRILAASRRALGDEHTQTLMTMNNLGWVLLSQGKFAEAESMLRQANEAQTRVLGPDHPDTLLSLSNLAMAESRQGRFADAEALIRRSYETDRRVLGENHAETLDTLGGLANCVLKQGRLDEAEALFRRAYEGYRATVGDTKIDTAYAASSLAMTLATAGRCKEAEALVRPYADLMRTDPFHDNPFAALPISALGYTLACQGNGASADPLLAEALSWARRTAGEKSRTAARVLYRAARADALLGRRDRALDELATVAASGLGEPGVLAEKDFTSMRDDPRFREIAGTIDHPAGGATH